MDTITRQQASCSPPPCWQPFNADALNRGCACRSLNVTTLRHELQRTPALAGLAETITGEDSHLFSAMAVFVARQQLDGMARIVSAVEQVVSLPAYRDAVLARAPAIARICHGPHGVLMGFDFHLSPSGPRIIEINTNAGGAMLNVALARAQQACCEPVAAAFEWPQDLAGIEQRFFEMFRQEWCSQRGDVPLRRVAIVDDDPAGQYLHPEFLLFQEMFRRHGVEAEIADPRELAWSGGRLTQQGVRVDLVYNRLTDFHLEQPVHAALSAAYEAGAVVVTPTPRAHALYADKRNLAILSDDRALQALGVDAAARAVLVDGIPRTERVTPERQSGLWAARRNLFFKPAAGYGGKAAYRGDKLTRRVWNGILVGDYVAQTLIPPSERVVDLDGADAWLKVDVRAYVYGGEILLFAARLYQGQTTNFRTVGGGFAPVLVVKSP